MQIAGCQPDSGNPTVRDERGAYGNVSYGGIRNPLHTLKRCMSETLCLRLRAPSFYPTPFCSYNSRGVSLRYLAAGCRYTARIRYYGLQATCKAKQVKGVLTALMGALGRLIKET